MTSEELKKILENHKLWLEYDLKGVRADLNNANLIGANLRGADLRGADLREADLNWINSQGIKGQKVIAVQVYTSRDNNLISYWKDLGIWTTGCFQGTLKELKEAIEETHKDNLKLKTRYERVIEFILKEAEE